MKHFLRISLAPFDLSISIESIYNASFRPNKKPAPHKSYDVPQQSYGSPQQSYNVPQQSYGVPQSTYGNPQSNYNVPQTGHGYSQQRISGSASQYHPQYVSAPDDNLVCKLKTCYKKRNLFPICLNTIP